MLTAQTKILLQIFTSRGALCVQKTRIVWYTQGLSHGIDNNIVAIDVVLMRSQFNHPS